MNEEHAIEGNPFTTPILQSLRSDPAPMHKLCPMSMPLLCPWGRSVTTLLSRQLCS